MNLDFCDEENLIFPFIDEQALKQKEQIGINSYGKLQNIAIKFNDIFDGDQSQFQPEKSRSKFFSTKHLKSYKQSKGELNQYIKQTMGNLKGRRKNIKHAFSYQLLKNIETIMLPSKEKQEIKAFLQSNYFLYFIRFIVCLNLIGIFLTDYSFRVNQAKGELIVELSIQNIVSLCFQLFANCAFTIELIMKFYQNLDHLFEPYSIISLIGTISCWATIFFDMIENDSAFVFQLFISIRIIRAFIKWIQVFQKIRTPFEIFISTIPSLYKLFFPLTIIILFYSITGMALFGGASHYKCQNLSDITKSTNAFCGSSLFQCHSNEVCSYIDVKQSDSIHNFFNLVNFDNLGNSLLTVYHFVFLSNWGQIKSRFNSFINPYVTSIFFISLAFFLFYIFANLIMISMSKAYMEETQSYHKKQQHREQIEKQSQQSQDCLFAKFLNVSNVSLIIIQTIIISITFEGMTNDLSNALCFADFILSWIAILVLLLLMALEKTKFFQNTFHLIDILCFACQITDIIICASKNTSVIYSSEDSSLILRSIKVVRIVRLLYLSKSFFSYEKYIIQVFLQTVFKVKYFLLLCVCFIFMFSQIGSLLFAYEVRYLGKQVNVIDGTPFQSNFETIWSATASVIYLFYNEKWAESMYYFYNSSGFQAIIFFMIVVFIAHLMLMRLYIAVFLSYFKEELHKISKKELIKTKVVEYQKTLTNMIIKNSKIDDLSHVVIKENNISDKLFWCIPKNIGFLPFLRTLYKNKLTNIIIRVCIFFHSITIILRSSNDSASKQKILNNIECVCFVIYLIETFVGCLVSGIYFEENSYLKESKSNVISFMTTCFIVISLIPFSDSLIRLYIKRASIIKIFTLFRQTDKEMTIICDTIFQISKRFINFIIIYIFLLLLVSIIPLKFLNSSTQFYTCENALNAKQVLLLSQEQCLIYHGEWINQPQRFNNIFSSIALMYEIVSSQSWTHYISRLWHNRSYWKVFFIIVFFIYNICFLNVFMGFIVETYLHLKDKAYNLNLLKRSQRGWILIKNSIHCLVPTAIFQLPENSSHRRKLVFSVVSNELYIIFFDYLAYFNAFLYIVTFQSAGNEIYISILNFFKNLLMGLFLLDTLAKIYTYRMSFFKLQNSTYDALTSLYICCYLIIHFVWHLSNENEHIANFFLVAFMLFRCRTLLFKYSWCKTHINSVFDILPKCIKIVKLLFVILFFYVSLGLQIFKYVKQNEQIDNYNYGFNNFLTGSLTLFQVISSESWYLILNAFTLTSSDHNLCYSITTLAEANQHMGEGCGNWFAYPYFLSFHIIMVLLIMNLLIATMASAYDQNYQIQFNSVNIFQLEDCLNLWKKYDPKGEGVVHYKKFWKLTSEIAILFGISKKKMIKRKNKFFQELDLQIYQSSKPEDEPILCYRFHDVITKFSKIKLHIANLNQEEYSSNEISIEFDISQSIMKEIKDYITPFPDELYSKYKPFKQYKSVETQYIFGLLKKLRQWKHKAASNKKVSKSTQLSKIFENKRDFLRNKNQIDIESNQKIQNSFQIQLHSSTLQ